MNGRVIINICNLLGLCAVVAGGSVVRRQVVQPTWLMRPDLLPKGPVVPVQVTAQNLQEAAALRSSIQKAVNENSYVVATNPEQYQIALAQLGYNNREIGASAPMPMPPPLPTIPMFPAFRLPNATWWQPRLFPA
ncbi:uncharacterized protein LOC117784271 [Drosophila innubila]|uniref:uncharacterized protein LOC117784271 n=1 Tax=Drosophila innubila TaxID=198719 RepID=UPI00148BDE44|nr:uncharacterized protein LOC117784271 [Drosophila innubila]